MKRKSILKNLLACSILSGSAAFAATINVNAPATDESHPTNAGVGAYAVLDDDYDFRGVANVLNISGDVDFQGSFVDAANGTLALTNTATDFNYSGNTTIDVGTITFGPSSNNLINSFTINNPNGTTTLNSEIDGSFTGAVEFNIFTPTIVTHSDATFGFARAGYVYVGTNTTPTSLTFRSLGSNTSYPRVYPSHEDSELIIDSTNSANNPLDLRFDGWGGLLREAPGTFTIVGTHGGILTLLANGNDISTRGIGGSYGINSTMRLKQVNFRGDSDITIHTSVYSKNLDFNNSANISLPADCDMGKDSQIELQQDANLFMTGAKTLEGEDTTLKLGSNSLNLLEGNLTLTGNAIFNVEFDDDASRNGKVVIGAGAQNAQLDLSGLNKLDINFTATTSNLNTDFNNQLEFSLPLIEEGPNGIFLNLADNNDITFNPTETNLFVNWSYDPDTQLIESTTDWDGLLKIVAPPAPAPVSQNVVNIVTAITETVNEALDPRKVKADELVTPTAEQKTAANFIKFAGTLPDVPAVIEAVKNMDPETSAEALDDNSVSFETGRIVLDRNVDSIASGGPQVVAAADETSLGYGVAAGDDLAKKYGFWATPFYHKAIQRKVDGNAGYKVENIGAVIGADTRVSESAIVGFAWGNVRSLVRMTDAKQGSKGDTSGNIFSLYTSLELPKNYFLTAIGSYGISKIKRLEKRRLARNISNFARSHYKTKMYSAEMIAGKNIYFKNQYTITPMAGIKFSEYRDDAYKETGTLFQNYNMTKKKYSHLDGSVGARFTYNTTFKDYKVMPNITGMAYFNLKDNPATSYVTSDTFTKPVQLKGDKRTAKAWYSVTGAIDFHKDNMEYSVEYEHQIDKKYVGHQAKIKAKINL